MSKLPKLKVKLHVGRLSEELREFEQGQYLPFSDDHVLIFVEDHFINSYDELVRLASQDSYKDKEFLEVLLTPAIGGG